MESTKRKLLARIACSSAGIFVGLVFTMTAYACPNPTTQAMVDAYAATVDEKQGEADASDSDATGAWAAMFDQAAITADYYADTYVDCDQTHATEVNDEIEAGDDDDAAADVLYIAAGHLYSTGVSKKNDAVSHPDLCSAYDLYAESWIAFQSANVKFIAAEPLYISAKGHYSDALQVMETDCAEEEEGSSSSSSSSS